MGRFQLRERGVDLTSQAVHEGNRGSTDSCLEQGDAIVKQIAGLYLLRSKEGFRHPIDSDSSSRARYKGDVPGGHTTESSLDMGLQVREEALVT